MLIIKIFVILNNNKIVQIIEKKIYKDVFSLQWNYRIFIRWMIYIIVR